MKQQTSFWEHLRKWGTPVLITVSTWLILDKLNSVMDSIKLIPGMSTMIAVHEARLATIDQNYNTFRGEYHELEKLVGTKEDKIDFPKPKK